MMNRAIFQYIEIGDAGDIADTTLTPPYQAISAWQPGLGRPKAAPTGAQRPPGAGLAPVRPSSGVADYLIEGRAIAAPRRTGI
jgi:hypothetical protein